MNIYLGALLFGLLVLNVQACNLITYSHNLITSDAPIRINPDFKPLMDIAGKSAVECNVQLLIKKSFVKDVDGKFLQGLLPSLRRPYSNHFVGHAVNFVIGKNAIPPQFCRKECLEQTTLPTHVKCFLDKILSQGWKWGKTYNDTTHFDDAFNVQHENEYNALRTSMQASCSN